MAASAASTLPPATYNTTNVLGVDVATANITTPSSLASQTQLFYPENSSPPFAPGQIVLAGGDTEYVFCQVGSVGSINQYDWVGFVSSVSSTFTVTQLTSTQVAVGARIGLCQVSMPATTSVTVQWAWIATRGSNIKGNFYASTAVNAPLIYWVQNGVLGSASASTVLISGVVNQASTGAGTASVAGVNVIATWPRAQAF